ncbi:MAG: RNA polymerase sigma factor [Myxococcota bacterium]
MGTGVSDLAAVPGAASPSAETSEHFRELVTQHFDFTWRSLRRLGVPEADVDDAAQEAFVVLARRLADVEPTRERAFLFATCVRIASVRKRSQRRRREHNEFEFEEIPHPAPSPEDLSGLSRARRLLQNILDHMSEDLRSVFILAELEELTAPEISALLDIPIGTVGSRLRAARDRFKTSVERLAIHDQFKGRRP